MSRSPIHATFTSSFFTTTTLLFPAPLFDNPTTPLIARRHTHEFPRIFASPAPLAQELSCLVGQAKAWWVRRNSRWLGSDTRTCHARTRLDGRAARPDSQANGFTSPASARSGELSETATAETTAQRVLPLLTVRVRPSCSRCLL